MTIEEAIAHAKEQKEIFSGTHGKFLDVAIAALEKQIPKKATDIRYFGEAGYYIGLCPCCKSGNNSEFQHCWDCGQAIDWEVEE